MIWIIKTRLNLWIWVSHDGLVISGLFLQNLGYSCVCAFVAYMNNITLIKCYHYGNTELN